MNILKHHSLNMVSMHIRTYVATDDTNRIDLYEVIWTQFSYSSFCSPLGQTAVSGNSILHQ